MLSAPPPPTHTHTLIPIDRGFRDHNVSSLGGEPSSLPETPKYATPNKGTGIQAMYLEQAQEPRHPPSSLKGAMVKGLSLPSTGPELPTRVEEPRMERAEPWSWVLETSSAGSPDFTRCGG